MNFPDVFKNMIKTTGNIPKGIRIVPYNSKQISPHVKLLGFIVVDQVKMKKDLLDDILMLMEQNVPKKVICKILNISEPYLNKLIRMKK